ncbi:MerR family transcriptional regulator [Streptomyces sp. NPDC006332]|uniref:MerR family transcriptional regulator n=1 Tax=Streptomyces sp. NPDC006332 TaxID=3155456 RepID=UPI0033BB7B81
MTTEAEEPTLTIDELAARAGVTVRTVRFYGTRGLLPPPSIGPRRVGHYGREHLARLALIEELQQQGMTLAAIERYLQQLPPGLSAHDLAIHRAVVASWAPDAVEILTPAELERRAGRKLGDEDLERLVAMNVIAPDAGLYRTDLGLLRLGVQLLDVPLSQEAILASREVLIQHSRAAAHELARLFGDEVSQRAAREVRSLSEHMRPLVLQALLTTFQRSLTEELRELLTDAPTDGAPGSPPGGAPDAAGGAGGSGGRSA